MSDADTRRWSASRIASAAVLLLLVLAAIAYGIYALVGSGGSHPKTTATNQQLTSPAPNSKSSKSGSITQPAKSTPKPSPAKTSNNPTSSRSTPVASSVGSNGASVAKSTPGASSATTTTRLSNTGPGDTAAIGFVAASVLGTAFHYVWRRRNVERF